MHQTLIKGVYAITDPNLCPNEQLLEKVTQAIHGGIRVLQYRDKNQPFAVQKQMASQLATLCKAHGVTFIINDSIELAQHCQADGLHLGKDDSALEAARQQLGPDAIIGISCYNSIERAREMQNKGADYVAFGRFFPSKTKPNAPQAEIETLRMAKQQLSVPIVAIGGIDAQNASALLEAGADSLAVIQGIFAQKQIKNASQTLANLFENREAASKPL